MSKKLVINASHQETRVALLEDTNLVEFYIERGNSANIHGNIYKGRIVRVLPGMQAAFVEVGLERTAFLYIADVQDDTKDFESLMDVERESEAPEAVSIHHDALIEEILTEGQEIIVQVMKEPIGTKGARVTSHLSLPGQYLVYMPSIHDHVRISRKIEIEEERERLQNIVLEAMPSEGGFIIRTACAGKDEDEILADMNYLLREWKSLKGKGDKVRPPSLLHQDLDVTLRTIRDMLSADIDEIIIDSAMEHQHIISFMDKFLTRMKSKAILYEGSELIFDNFGIEMEVDAMLREKVWLKSGGYIIIQHTEALTAIDVNTGKFTGKKNLEETIVKTNLEAAKEITYQLRLRNIGGIIILDFIDMVRLENREKVHMAMIEALRKDRAITRVSKISELGLMEMTRKRIRSSIIGTMCSPCEYCEGKGYIKSHESISYEILRTIKRDVRSFFDKDRHVKVHVHPALSDILLGPLADEIHSIEKQYTVKIDVKANPSLHLEDYHIY